MVKKSAPKRGASKKPVKVDDDDDSDDFEDPDLMEVPGAKIQAKSLANIRGGPSGSMPNFGKEYFVLNIRNPWINFCHFEIFKIWLFERDFVRSKLFVFVWPLKNTHILN